MLARRWRLVRDRDFQNVYRKGRRFRGRGVTLCILRLDQPSPSRLAVVVSRQVDRRATRRNLLKRRVWATIRQHHIVLPSKGYHLVWIVQRTAVSMTYVELANEISNIVRKLH